MAVAIGYLIVPIEARSKKANILSVEDGLWWSVTTMTGVGYGDRVPVTTTGRLVGSVLQVLGIIVFGLIVGHIAVALFRIRDDFYWKRLFTRIDDIEERIKKIESGQKFIVRSGNDSGDDSAKIGE